MADVKQFKLPDVGEGLTEADIVSWKVKPGDVVTVNQVIVEIETAKSLVELPSPFDGIVTDLLVSEGQSVDVGTPIIAVDVSADAGAAEAVAGESGPAGTVPAANTASGTAPAAPAETAEEETAAREPGIEGSPAPKIERQAVLVGYGVKLGTTTRRPRKGRAGGGAGAGRAPREAVTPPSPAGNGA
jgi:2-oxoisovalerate dehydrogenase E2 component (dihydrolipoyl transacylase)